MTLQRLAAAIRHQNWFTVAIEFVIVVTGIFVGLQVNNWNEDRLDRVREHASLQRLLDEAENAVAYIARDIEDGAARIDGQRELLKIIFSAGPLPEDTASAEMGFSTLNFFPAMAPVRTAYDELAAAGGIQLIRSRRVRDMISLYYAEIDFFQAQLDYFRMFSSTAENDTNFAARNYIRSYYDPDDDSGRRFDFEWPGLRADPYLGTLFVNKFRNQIVMNQNRERVLERAQLMCDAIAGAIDRECEPALSNQRD